MNELDLIARQNESLASFAKDLLSSEARIKKQQRDYFQFGSRSIEAEKVEYANFEMRMLAAVCEELHQRALHILQLEQIGREYIAAEAQNQAEKSREQFYASLYDNYHKQDIKKYVGEQLKALVTLLTNQITKIDRIINEISAQISALQASKQTIIETQLLPNLQGLGEQLQQSHAGFITVSIDSIDSQPPRDSQLPWQALFTELGKQIQNGTCTVNDFLNMGAPYHAIERALAGSETPLSDSDKINVRDRMWHAVQQHPLYAKILQDFSKVEAINQSVNYLESTKAALANQQAILKEELSAAYTGLSALRGAADKEEVQAIHRQAQAGLDLMPHLENQVNELVVNGRDALAHVEQQGVSRQIDVDVKPVSEAGPVIEAAPAPVIKAEEKPVIEEKPEEKPEEQQVRSIRPK